MRRSTHALLGCLLLAACESSTKPPSAEPGEELSGGATTVVDTSRDAYSRPASNLLEEHRSAFFTGNTLFNRNWVTAPSSTEGSDGLGPTFNARSCSACHFKDGRGEPPEGSEPFVGLLLRLSVPGQDEHGAPLPEPHYGGQFNHHAINGTQAEGEAYVEYEEQKGKYADGTEYSLLAPTYRFAALAFDAMSPDVMVSPRVAPAVYGLGLLSAIPEETLRELEDPQDEDGDGISGRLNVVWDPKNQSKQIGRFGWKANQAGLEQQNAGALLGDMGLTTPLFPAQDCPEAQLACREAYAESEPEIDQQKLDFFTLYTSLLAVPARRNVSDPQVLRGKRQFRELGCASCHIPTLQTGAHPSLVELSEQTIHPYTDLLLHDMGEGLADGRPDFEASGSEWRTPALWGIGLLLDVNRHTRLLHDGRARDVSEAILWHGGEAEAAKQGFVALSAPERADLLAFMASL